MGTAPPKVCFGLWGPDFDVAFEEGTFAPQKRSADGAWRPDRSRGPTSFHVWLKCWTVFEVAMISLGAASDRTLREYAGGVEKLTKKFTAPEDWPRIMAAEERVRNHWWDRLREEKLAAIPPQMHEAEGWERIIKETTFTSMSAQGNFARFWEENSWWPLIARRIGAAAAPVQPAPSGYTALPAASAADAWGSAGAWTDMRADHYHDATPLGAPL